MKKYLEEFLREKPFFFSLLRPKEAQLYQAHKPFKQPVLDLGCGDGFFAKVAFGKVDVGIDPDKNSIEEAKIRNIYKTVRAYDGKKIPYKDGYFSTVVCNSTFEHISNIGQTLKEVSRVTKKGGMLYFTVPTNRWAEYLFLNKIFGKWYSNYFIKKSKHWNLYSYEKWEEVLRKLGFGAIYKTHYLDNKKIMYIFDISHYLSIGSLLTKKLLNRWVVFPQKVKLFGSLQKVIIKHTKQNTVKGPYLFIAAKKVE